MVIRRRVTAEWRESVWLSGVWEKFVVVAGGSDELALSYRVNPIDELRPVCPNCHAMLHQIRPALAINELQSLLQ